MPGNIVSIELIGLSTLPVIAASGLFWRERMSSRKARRDLDEASQAKDRALKHDPTTGLLNRHGIKIALEERSRSAKEGGSCFCALYLCIDEFSYQNCFFGQELGESLTKLLIKRLERSLPSSVDVSVTGEGRFVILMAGNAAVGLDAAGKIMRDLHLPFEHKNGDVFLTCSIGVAVPVRVKIVVA